MAKQIPRIIVALLVILTFSSGSIILALRLRILDAQTYKRAIAPSSVYLQFRLDLEDWFIDQVADAPSKESPIAKHLLETIDFKQFTVPTAEKNIESFFSWLSSETPEFILYFPREEVNTYLASADFKTRFDSGLDTAFASIPDCSTLDPLTIDNSGLLPTCIDDPVADRAKVDSAVSAIFVKLNSGEVMTQFFNDAEIPQLADSTSFSNVLSELTPSRRMELSDGIQAYKDMASSSLIIGVSLIFFSLFLTAIVLFTGKQTWRDGLATFSMMFIGSGIAILAFSWFARTTPSIIVDQLPLYFFKDGEVPMQYINYIAAYHKLLMELLFEMALFVGASVLVLSIMLELIALLLPQTESEKAKTRTIGEDLPVDNSLQVDLPTNAV